MTLARLQISERLAQLTGGRLLIEREVLEPPSIKDAVEAVGIPHTEVDRLSAGNRMLSWSDSIPDGDLVSVSGVPPAATEHEVPRPGASPPGLLQPRPLARDRFVCDLHLGTLARLLRMLGLNTAWETSGREAEMARIATAQGRAVLTRNRQLLMRRSLAVGLLLRSDDPDTQAIEVLRRFVGRPAENCRIRHGRCSLCNGRLAVKTLAEVRELVPPRTAAWLDTYYYCRACGKLFWEGTHYERLRARLTAIITAADQGSS